MTAIPHDSMTHDLLVIGGGINGAGIARDAQGRGLKVALVTARDLAEGTSSASTKLIHGGLRYLEHGAFGLVAEALAERERLWSIAPHIIWPIRLVLPHRARAGWSPTERATLRPRWRMRAGLALYDRIGGRDALLPAEAVDLAAHPAGRALRAPDPHAGWGLAGGARDPAHLFSDCWVEDHRLVVLNARDAADRGAVVHTRARVTALSVAEGVWTATVSPAAGAAPDTPGTIRARAIINAAGPGAPDVLALTGLAPGASVDAGPDGAMPRLRLVRGSHIVIARRWTDPTTGYFLQNDDGRVLFALPIAGRFTLIGTTDVDDPGDGAAPVPDAAEIAYLCAKASRWLARPVGADDVVASFAGVRPLVDDGQGRPDAAGRGYRFDRRVLAGAPMLTVLGGKLTTYRVLAEKALAMLGGMAASGADGTAGLPVPQRSWTADAPLPGGDIARDGVHALVAALCRDEQAAPPGARLADDAIAAMVRRHGTGARTILADRRPADAPLPGGWTMAEVRHAVRREWVRDGADLLRRRSWGWLTLPPADEVIVTRAVAAEVARSDAARPDAAPPDAARSGAVSAPRAPS